MIKCDRKRLNPTATVMIAISLSLVVLLSLLYGYRPDLFDSVRWKWADRIVVCGPDVPATDGVIVIDIDEQSLEAMGQWPWSRAQLAALLEKIAAMKASAIALDFIMAEPDRTAAMVAHANNVDLHGSPPMADSPKEQRQKPDEILTRTLSRGPFVLGYSFTFDGKQRNQTNCPPHPISIEPPGSTSRGHTALPFFQAQGVICNLPQFSRAAAYSGFLNGQPDADERIRRLPLLISHNGAVYPSLFLAALMTDMADTTVTVQAGSGEQPCLEVGPYAIPVDRKGRLAIRFAAGRSNLPHISAKAVMADQVNAASVSGKIALVGLSAAGLATTYATPGNGRYTAVEVQAQAIETILGGSHIRRNGKMVLWETLLAWMAALLLGLCVSRLATGPFIGIGLVAIAACWGGTQLLFNTRQVLMSPLLTVAAITINGPILLLVTYWIRQNNAHQGMHEALVLMKSSQKELDSIITTIPDIIFRLDASGRITFISSAVVRYNRQPEDLIGTPILELVSPEDREKAFYRINERRTGERATSDLEIRLNISSSANNANGHDRYFSISAVGIYASPKARSQRFIGTQGIAKDISQRKQLEQQLKQAQQMEAMGSLAAGVAHDLNNILSGLVGYPELLLLDLPENSPMRSQIETIQRAGKRAADIVQDLLMIARRGVEDHIPTDINRTIGDYLKTLEFKQMEKAHPNIRFEVCLAEELIPANGSSVHLSKVVTNLVRNAVEAMPAGGTIRIETANRYLDTALDGYERIPEGEYVIIRIADEGVGIPDELLPRIFEPFYSKKRMGSSGSGLGMTVVLNTVKDHSGFIDIQSSEAEGTRFEIYLPAARNAEIAVKNRVVLEDYTGTERILVVDDIAEQRALAVRMLSRLGYRVASVSSGEEALTYLRKQSVDLVVLDMVMPKGIDGYETYRRILELQPAQKAIIASGYATSERVRETQDIGAGEYVRKPYTLENIGLAVRRELDRG